MQDKFCIYILHSRAQHECARAIIDTVNDPEPPLRFGASPDSDMHSVTSVERIAQHHEAAAGVAEALSALQPTIDRIRRDPTVLSNQEERARALQLSNNMRGLINQYQALQNAIQHIDDTGPPVADASVHVGQVSPDTSVAGRQCCNHSNCQGCSPEPEPTPSPREHFGWDDATDPVSSIFNFEGFDSSDDDDGPPPAPNGWVPPTGFVPPGVPPPPGPSFFAPPAGAALAFDIHVQGKIWWSI